MYASKSMTQPTVLTVVHVEVNLSEVFGTVTAVLLPVCCITRA
jgi:hypothetical protein